MAKKKTSRLKEIGRNSVGLILPAAILDQLGWRKKQRVIAKKVPRGILIIDAMSKKKKKK